MGVGFDEPGGFGLGAPDDGFVGGHVCLDGVVGEEGVELVGGEGEAGLESGEVAIECGPGVEKIGVRGRGPGNGIDGRSGMRERESHWEDKSSGAWSLSGK